MTKLTKQEIADGWQLNTGEQPVPDGVIVAYYAEDYDGAQDRTSSFQADKLGWGLGRGSIQKWRINPEYKAKLEEQARAVFPELNWPDPLEAKAGKLIAEYGMLDGPDIRKFARAAIKAGMEPKS